MAERVESGILLSPLDKKIMEVLKQEGGWATRKRLIQLLGVTNLNSHQLHKLERLANFGLIERREQVKGAVKVTFEYRYVRGLVE